MTVFEKYKERFGWLDDYIDYRTPNKSVNLNNFELEEAYIGYTNEQDEDRKQYLHTLIYLALISRCYVWIRYYMSKANDNETREDLLQEAYLTYIRCHELSNTIRELEVKFFGKLRENCSRYIDEKTSLIKITRTAKKTIDEFYKKLYDSAVVNNVDKRNIEDTLYILATAEIYLTDEEYKTFVMYSGIYGKYTHQDIAEELGIEKRRVKSIIGSFQKKLKKVF